MQITVKIHGTALKSISPRELTIELNDAETINSLLSRISNSFEPEIKRSILDGRVWKEAMIFLDGINIIYLKGRDTTLEDKCTVTIIPAVVGG